MPYDSVAYNADNTPAALFTEYDISGHRWQYRIQFEYNDRQQCTFARWYGYDDFYELDSLVYGAGKVTVFKLSPDDYRVMDSTFISFNGDNQVTLAGSKDTVYEAGDKRLSYTEFTYSGGNPVKVLTHEFESHSGTVSSTLDEYTYTYDNNPNPFVDMFSRNPYLMIILHGNGNDLFSLGKNSLLSFTRKYGNGIQTALNFVNTYDADGKLATQKTMDGSIRYTIQYNYIKEK